jgi:hypothetical protein
MSVGPFASVEDYKFFVYSLPAAYPEIKESSLVLVRSGARLAAVRGTIAFVNGWSLVVMERFRWDRTPLVLDAYGYEAWNAGKKQCWYDPQPHPEAAELQVTFPHHKHVPPEIKRNRVPAPGITFTGPNLPQLIHEISGSKNSKGKV